MAGGAVAGVQRGTELTQRDRCEAGEGALEGAQAHQQGRFGARDG